MVRHVGVEGYLLRDNLVESGGSRDTRRLWKDLRRDNLVERGIHEGSRRIYIGIGL